MHTISSFCCWFSDKDENTCLPNASYQYGFLKGPVVKYLLKMDGIA
jgi:hypothetical protein